MRRNERKGKTRIFLFGGKWTRQKLTASYFSLHVKSTMMRISDPIIFGHCVSVYYQDVLDKHSAEMGELAVNPDNGIAELYTKIQSLTDEKRARNRSRHPVGL
ncbi:MAG: hypothetical protein Ct9H300mP11_28360 [Chloroflexota bacterium]|nr:MAG: hypothetical protein Ct9H300mP11_28360 [Chloroflexota bacterium]